MWLFLLFYIMLWKERKSFVCTKNVKGSPICIQSFRFCSYPFKVYQQSKICGGSSGSRSYTATTLGEEKRQSKENEKGNENPIQSVRQKHKRSVTDGNNNSKNVRGTRHENNNPFMHPFSTEIYSMPLLPPPLLLSSSPKKTT